MSSATFSKTFEVSKRVSFGIN